MRTVPYCRTNSRQCQRWSSVRGGVEAPGGEHQTLSGKSLVSAPAGTGTASATIANETDVASAAPECCGADVNAISLKKPNPFSFYDGDTLCPRYLGSSIFRVAKLAPQEPDSRNLAPWGIVWLRRNFSGSNTKYGSMAGFHWLNDQLN